MSLDDIVHHAKRILMELLRFSAHFLVIEYFRVTTVRVPSTQLPGLKEWIPIEERYHLLKAHFHYCISEHFGRRLRGGSLEIDYFSLLDGIFELNIIAIFQRSIVVFAHLFVLLEYRLHELLFAIIQQIRNHRHGSRGIQDMYDGVLSRLIGWSDLDSSVHL